MGIHDMMFACMCKQLQQLKFEQVQLFPALCDGVSTLSMPYVTSLPCDNAQPDEIHEVACLVALYRVRSQEPIVARKLLFLSLFC